MPRSSASTSPRLRAPASTRSSRSRTCTNKGDELRIAGATFLVHRVIGTYQTDVYKKGVKRPYLLNQIDRDRLAVFVLRGTLESTFAEPPVLIVDVSQVKLVRGYSYSVKSVRG